MLSLRQAKRKKSSIVRPSTSTWRSLRPMNIFMSTDDSSFEESSLEQSQRDAACVSRCSKLVATQDKLRINLIFFHLFPVSSC